MFILRSRWPRMTSPAEWVTPTAWTTMKTHAVTKYSACTKFSFTFTLTVFRD